MYEYKTTGTCASKILFDIEERDNKKYVKDVQFIGGCSGNTQGVAKLIEGMEVNDAISRISGIRCGYKATSCPDQLAQAIKSVI